MALMTRACNHRKCSSRSLSASFWFDNGLGDDKCLNLGDGFTFSPNLDTPNWHDMNMCRNVFLCWEYECVHCDYLSYVNWLGVYNLVLEQPVD